MFNLRSTPFVVCISIIALLIGSVLGFVAGLALGSQLVTVFRISSFEGEAGYFAFAIGVIGGLLGAVFSTLFALYILKVSGKRMFYQLVYIVVGLAAISFGAFEYYQNSQPIPLRPNQSPVRLAFEVRPPSGEVAFDDKEKIRISIDTDQNSDDASLQGNDNPALILGEVDLYFRTSRRFIVVHFANGVDKIFDPSLPADPTGGRYHEWSDWIGASYTGRPGEPQPIRESDTIDYQIRYRVIE